MFQSSNAKASTAHALAMGYRHIDSARYYHVRLSELVSRSSGNAHEHSDRPQNEDEVCAAVHKFKDGMPNEGTGAVWLTTKVQGQEHGTAATAKAVDESAAIAKKYGLTWVRFVSLTRTRRRIGRVLTPDTLHRTSSSSTTRRRASRSASRRGRYCSRSATRVSSSRRACPTSCVVPGSVLRLTSPAHP